MVYKKANILCTLGPASENPAVLGRMVHAGMDAVRINTAHGSIKQNQAMIRAARGIADLPVVVDIKGPEVRIETIDKSFLENGGTLKVGFKPDDEVHFTRDIYDQLSVGNELMIHDGLIRTKVCGKKDGYVLLKVKTGGSFEGNKGVNLPGRRIDVPLLSERDVEGIRMALRTKADFIALSFTRDTGDVEELRRHLRDSTMGIIAKIENAEGLRNIDSIIDAADGIMVARGDLGVEIPAEKLPLIQKDIVLKCNIKGKLVIVATEMLKTMVENPRPTRAETSDVANAILDGADTVMLSEETTIGRYPVQAVETMTKIIREVEPYVSNKVPLEKSERIYMSIGKAVYDICQHLPVDKIVTLTRSGHTARLISRFRMHKDIIAVTSTDDVKRKLGLYYGVTPVIYKNMPAKEKIKNTALFLNRHGMLEPHETVLFTAGIYTEKEHATNIIQIHRMKEFLAYYRKHG
jgi:pyruvate kinase